MKIPNKAISPAAFDAAVETWLAEHTTIVRPMTERTCKTCRSFLRYFTVYVSIHYGEFPGCAGGGECTQMSLPYCPQCEQAPPERERYTCVHIGLPANVRSSGLSSLVTTAERVTARAHNFFARFRLGI
jgi:hypothetical protein